MNTIAIDFKQSTKYTTTSVAKGFGIPMSDYGKNILYQNETYTMSKICFNTSEEKVVPNSSPAMYNYPIFGIYFEFTLNPSGKNPEAPKFIYFHIPVIEKTDNKPYSDKDYAIIRKSLLDFTTKKADSDWEITIDATLFRSVPNEEPTSMSIQKTQAFVGKNLTSGLVITLEDLAINARPAILYHITNSMKSLNPPNLKDATYETVGMLTVKDNTSTSMKCSRKANTGVINNTIMGDQLATELIKSNKHITAASVVMLFISLMVIVVVHLKTKAENTDFLGNPLAIITDPMMRGGGCLDDAPDLKWGYMFYALVGLVILQFAGIYRHTDFAIAGSVLFVVTIVYGVVRSPELSEAGFNHIFLNDASKPFSKIPAIAAYITFLLTLQGLIKRTIHKDELIGLVIYYVLLHGMALFAYIKHDIPPFTSIVSSGAKALIAVFCLFILIAFLVSSLSKPKP
jgi:hypothetical protein